MPYIPQNVIRGVFYLYADTDAASAGRNPGGTGFIVRYDGTFRGDPGHHFYGVTNWHVACDGGFSVIRLNKKDGGTDIIELGPEDWYFLPGRYDVAVIPLALNGEVHDISSQDVNEYLREITDEDFSAKDFRTLAGTVLTAIALNAQEKFETKKQAKSNINNAVKAVAQILGNTPAICRKCYVHPEIFENYLDQKSIEELKQLTEDALEKEDVDLRSSEKAVLKFLETRLAKKAA